MKKKKKTGVGKSFFFFLKYDLYNIGRCYVDVLDILYTIYPHIKSIDLLVPSIPQYTIDNIAKIFATPKENQPAHLSENLVYYYTHTHFPRSQFPTACVTTSQPLALLFANPREEHRRPRARDARENPHTHTHRPLTSCGKFTYVHIRARGRIFLARRWK